MPVRRKGRFVVAILVLVVGAVALQRCTQRVPSPSSSPSNHVAGDGTAVRNAPASISANREIATRAARDAHAASVSAAVDTLHAYLAVLFKPDRSEADAYWVDGGPAGSGEADLRSLDAVHGLRIENEPPIALSDAVPPEALEIPVRLRISIEGLIREYRGRYRLRRSIEGDAWKITSASIDASPLRR